MSDGKPDSDPQAIARYIQRMARELRTLATKSELSFLAYLLAMAEDEAAATARQPDGK
jgi:hypothetical protein